MKTYCQRRNTIKLKILEFPLLIEIISNFTPELTHFDQDIIRKNRIIEDLTNYYNSNKMLKENKKVKVKLTYKEWDLVYSILLRTDEEELYYKDYDKQEIVCSIRGKISSFFNNY